MRSLYVRSSVRLLVATINMSPPEHMSTTLCGKREDAGTTSLTMRSEPKGFFIPKPPILRSYINLGFPSFHVIR